MGNAAIHTSAPATLDSWMLFGFLASVVLLTMLAIGRRTILSSVARAVCFASLAVYACASNVWPLGIVLVALAASDLAHMAHMTRGSAPSATRRFGSISRKSIDDDRMARMFGERGSDSSEDGAASVN